MRKSLTAISIAALMGAVLVGLPAPGAEAGIIGGQPDAKIKGPGMPSFVGGDYYGDEPIPQQTISGSLPEGGVQSFKVKVQNDSISSDRFLFGGYAAGTVGLKVQFYRGNKKITQKMFDGLYLSPKVPETKSHTIRFVVKDRGAPLGSSSLEVAVFVLSRDDPESKDSVAALISH